MTEYCASLAERGLKYNTYARTENHLAALLQIEPHGRRRITSLRGRGQELYDHQVELGVAVDTHRNALAAGKAFGKYSVKRGWLKASPFAEVEGIGRRKRGKPQLHVDEARKLMDHCLALCEHEVTSEPVAVLTALLLGPRATEVVRREVRDLDDRGRLLWIPDSKTDNGRRILEVPEVLRPLLLELARDRIAAAPLFRDRHGQRPTRTWIWYHCRKLCRDAKVPEVSPHGMRGTGSSIARAAGATAELVAAQLGHGSVSVQGRGRYVTDRAAAAGRTATVVRRLAGNSLGTTPAGGNARSRK